eukprot:gene9598-1822_t
MAEITVSNGRKASGKKRGYSEGKRRTPRSIDKGLDDLLNSEGEKEEDAQIVLPRQTLLLPPPAAADVDAAALPSVSPLPRQKQQQQQQHYLASLLCLDKSSTTSSTT